MLDARRSPDWPSRRFPCSLVEYGSKPNKLPFGAHAPAPLLIMPVDFAAVAVLGA